jgi:hypothetical protein
VSGSACGPLVAKGRTSRRWSRWRSWRLRLRRRSTPRCIGRLRMHTRGWASHPAPAQWAASMPPTARRCSALFTDLDEERSFLRAHTRWLGSDCGGRGRGHVGVTTRTRRSCGARALGDAGPHERPPQCFAQGPVLPLGVGFEYMRRNEARQQLCRWHASRFRTRITVQCSAPSGQACGQHSCCGAFMKRGQNERANDPLRRKL